MFVWGVSISCLWGGPNCHPTLHEAAITQLQVYNKDHRFVSMFRQSLAVSLQILRSFINNRFIAMRKYVV